MLAHRVTEVRRLAVTETRPAWNRALAVLFVLLLPVSTALAQTPAATLSEQLLETAWQLESSADYAGASEAYRRYLVSHPPKSASRRNARLKLPVLQEATVYGASAELDLFLSALNSRAAGDTASALALVDRIIRDHPISHYYDDAMYLKAYIELMDNYDFSRAHNTLESLRYADPQSRYYDTALYAEAIAQEQLGNRQLAITKLQELRERHSSLSVAGLYLPRDQFTSRLWFDRSNERLEYLQQYPNQASTLISMRPYGENGYQWRAVVTVAGQDMTLLLNQSLVTKDTKIVSGDGRTIDTTDTNAFAGIVEGENDSWVRITLSENNLRGMISVFGERYRLVPTETGGSLSDINPLLLGDIDGFISEQPDQVLYPPVEKTAFDDYLRNIRVAEGIKFQEGTVGLTASIGVVIDSKFNNYHGGRGAEEAKSILNTADGIFREQFGLALHIDTIIVIDSADDPMNLGSVTMETMMRNFSSYRKASSDLGSDISMATLFSGNKNSDSALGLAWIGSVCRTDGYDVSVVSPYRLADLLSTHEIGHTLGAQHDSDTSCAGNSQHIMWPYLSSSTRKEFSSCSKDSVQQLMANGSCFIETIDIRADLVVSENYIEASVVNNDPLRTSGSASLTIAGTAVGSLPRMPDNCAYSGANLVCHIGSLVAGGSATVALELSAALTDNDRITAVVKPIGYMDSEPDNNSITGDKHGNLHTVAGPSINSSPGTPVGATPSAGGDAAAAGSMDRAQLLILIALMLLAWHKPAWHRRLINRH
ncbi:MAG: M12 family metallo-peptidase [Pseudomonadota bacterium]